MNPQPETPMSTNPTPVEMKPCPRWLIMAIDSIRTRLQEHDGDRPDCQLCRVADHVNAAFGEAVGEPIEATRPPASAAPVDELVERLRRTAKIGRESGVKAAGLLADGLDEAADQLTIYARRVAELEAEVERLQQAPTEADPSYAAMRAALTGEHQQPLAKQQG